MYQKYDISRIRIRFPENSAELCVSVSRVSVFFGTLCKTTNFATLNFVEILILSIKSKKLKRKPSFNIDTNAKQTTEKVFASTGLDQLSDLSLNSEPPGNGLHVSFSADDAFVDPLLEEFSQDSNDQPVIKLEVPEISISAEPEDSEINEPVESAQPTGLTVPDGSAGINVKKLDFYFFLSLFRLEYALPDCYKNMSKMSQSGNISGFISVFCRIFFRKFDKKS